MSRQRVAILVAVLGATIACVGLLAQVVSLYLQGVTGKEGTAYIAIMLIAAPFSVLAIPLALRWERAGVIFSTLAGAGGIAAMVVVNMLNMREDGYPALMLLLCLGVIAPGIVLGTKTIVVYAVGSVAFCLVTGIVYQRIDQAFIAICVGVWAAFVAWLLCGMLNEQENLRASDSMFKELLETMCNGGERYRPENTVPGSARDDSA